MRAACARAQDANIVLPRLPARGAPFRGEDLADPTDAGVEAGRTDPPLHRRPASAFRIADRTFPVLRIPHLRHHGPDWESRRHGVGTFDEGPVERRPEGGPSGEEATSSTRRLGEGRP